MYGPDRVAATAAAAPARKPWLVGAALATVAVILVVRTVGESLASESREASLAIPVAGVQRSQLRNTFAQSRGGHVHEAIDIAAPRGTKVFAVADGTVIKLFNSVPGGLTVYQLDRQQRRFFYYAHLDRYAPGLREGMAVRRCELLGYVGSTGNAAADAPHLHFAIFLANEKKQWWQGVAINPFAFFGAPLDDAPDC